MSNEPFFVREGDTFVPTPSSRGPWDPKSLHGRVIAGLLGNEIERHYGAPEFIPARLTVDMYRLPTCRRWSDHPGCPRGPPDQGGRRGVHQRRDQHGPGHLPAAAPHREPGRQCLEPAALGRAAAQGHHATGERPQPDGGMWATLPISGAFGSVGKKRLW